MGAATATTTERSDDQADGGARTPRDLALRLTLTLWSVAIAFAVVTLIRSEQVGIPLRDPDAVIFRRRLTTAVISVVVLALADVLVRTALSYRARAGSGPVWARFAGVVRRQWPWSRVGLVGSALLAYHVVYVCYRNLKSWDAFNTPRDSDLAAADRWLFLGHTPAAVVHGIFGEGAAAPVLAFVYRSFTYLVPFSIVATLALMPQVRRAYVMVCAGVWVWILGLGSYYLIPSLGPFASAPSDFSGLRETAITATQAEYLTEREHLLTNPQAHDAFASISAFASLHVGFTCTVLLVALYFRWRIVSILLAVYLAGVMVATVYFGWHFFVDDLAGVLLAVIAVGLALLMVRGPSASSAPRPSGAVELPVTS